MQVLMVSHVYKWLCLSSSRRVPPSKTAPPSLGLPHPPATFIARISLYLNDFIHACVNLLKFCDPRQ